LEAGLAVVFAEDPPEQRTGPQAEIIKPTWLDLCPAYYAQPVGQYLVLSSMMPLISLSYSDLQ
jgi:hypothetical protein